MIQPKIVVRNTISGRRPPAPERREKPGRRQEGIQGGGKLTPLQTTGCRLARIRQAVQGTQGGDKREARAEERPLPPRAEASSALGGMQRSMSPPNPLMTETSRPQLVGA